MAVTRMRSNISGCEECKWLRAQLSSSEMQHLSQVTLPQLPPDSDWTGWRPLGKPAVGDARYLWWVALTPWLLSALGKSFHVTALSNMLPPNFPVFRITLLHLGWDRHLGLMVLLTLFECLPLPVSVAGFEWWSWLGSLSRWWQAPVV